MEEGEPGEAVAPDGEKPTEERRREDSPDWYLMTEEETAEEEQLNAELEAKKQDIEDALARHELWRKKFEEKKTEVEERWTNLQEKREHRKFMEKMITG